MGSTRRRLLLALSMAWPLACGATGPSTRDGHGGPVPTVVLPTDVGAPSATMAPGETGKPRSEGLAAVPADIPHKLDVSFEDKVHLVGYKLDPPFAAPGREVKLTFWWRCDEALGDGWQLLTHTRDGGTGKMGNLDNVGSLREPIDPQHQRLGPDRWVPGRVYVDEQTYTVPLDVAGSVTVLVGIWKQDARLRILTGTSDGDNRAIVGTIETGVLADNVPTLTVPRLPAGRAIVVDGKGDEPAWTSAVSTGPFVDVGTGKPNLTFPVNGSARLIWDDSNLYVFFDVEEVDLYRGFTTPRAQPGDFTASGQPKLWTRDTVEMMLEPDATGAGRDYYELQVGPQNKVFKSQFDAPQVPTTLPNGPYGHEDWDPRLKSAVQIHKGPDGKPSGYGVEVAIPWAGYTKAAHHPPQPGEVWRANFYAMKNNGGVSWSPILGQGNFHKASRFGRIVWAR